MSIADRWLLPDGIDELLPAQAARAETLRRTLLDLYRSWGYELVMPPLVEFCESLLVNGNSDLALQTCKITDQLSGRMMGIRADITPQTARIDAHRLNQAGATRLCYAGSTLHARPKSALASRSPIQLGCEFYGVASLDADLEVISLMLATAEAAGIHDVTLDLGHVGIYRFVAACAGLNEADEQRLFDILARQALTELRDFAANTIQDADARALVLAMPSWKGDVSVLKQVAHALAKAPADVQQALSDLQQVCDLIASRAPHASIYIDLAELRGYHYHTGVVYALFVRGAGQALVNGGRFDNYGEAFGRRRPATGFSADLKQLLELGSAAPAQHAPIWAALDGTAAQWQAISALRAEGHIVIAGSAGEPISERCQQQLVADGASYTVQAISH